jgi:hypothetical protein
MSQALHPGYEEEESRSELGRQIAIDLETDADLDQRGCRPGHWLCSLSFSFSNHG